MCCCSADRSAGPLANTTTRATDNGAKNTKQQRSAIFLASLVAGTFTHLLLALGGGFWALAAAVALSEALSAPATLLADAAVVAAARDDGDYGRARVWGAWGWGGVGAASGFVVQRFGARAAFGGYVALMAPCVCAAALMECDPLKGRAAAAAAAAAASEVELAPPGREEGGGQQKQQRQLHRSGAAGQPPSAAPPAGAAGHSGGGGGDDDEEGAPLLSAAHDNTTQQQQQQKQHPSPAPPPPAPAVARSFSTKLAIVLTSPAVLVFFLQATIMGFGIGVIGEFLFLYLKQDMGATEALMGLSLTVTCAAEIPAFYAQGALLKRVAAGALLHWVVAAYALRLGLYGLLPIAGSPWAVLPVELLHGVCFGCGWGGGTVQAKRLARRLGVEGLEATMQVKHRGVWRGKGSSCVCLWLCPLCARGALSLAHAHHRQHHVINHARPAHTTTKNNRAASKRSISASARAPAPRRAACWRRAPACARCGARPRRSRSPRARCASPPSARLCPLTTAATLMTLMTAAAAAARGAARSEPVMQRPSFTRSSRARAAAPTSRRFSSSGSSSSSSSSSSPSTTATLITSSGSSSSDDGSPCDKKRGAGGRRPLPAGAARARFGFIPTPLQSVYFCSPIEPVEESLWTESEKGERNPIEGGGHGGALEGLGEGHRLREEWGWKKKTAVCLGGGGGGGNAPRAHRSARRRERGGGAARKERGEGNGRRRQLFTACAHKCERTRNVWGKEGGSPSLIDRGVERGEGQPEGPKRARSSV